MLDKKHSIEGLWKNIKPYVLEYSKNTDEPEYIDVIEDYCKQIHKIDSDANKFRYPMTNTMQVYFSQNKRFDFVNMGNFFEALNNILDGIDSEFNSINEIKAESKAGKIGAYCKVIQKNFKYFNSETVYFYKSRIELKPWKNWSDTNDPTWWTMYNKVKHHRMETDSTTKRQYYNYLPLCVTAMFITCIIPC